MNRQALSYIPTGKKFASYVSSLGFLTLYLLVSSLITFANTLNPDQPQQRVGPDLGPRHYNTLMVFLTLTLKTKVQNYPVDKEVA